MLQGEPYFETAIEHCPLNPREENQCVGKFAIYAYLHVTGLEIDNANAWTLGGVMPWAGLSVTGSANATPPWRPNWSPRDDRILPIRVEIPFHVDFADSPAAKDTVHECGATPVPQPKGPQPRWHYDDLLGGVYPVRVDFNRVGATVVLKEKDDCLSGVVTFNWTASRLLIHGAGGGVAHAPLPWPLPPINAGANAGGAVAVGGSPYELKVNFELGYRDGCYRTGVPDTSGDAIAVWRMGGKFSP